MLLVLPIIFMVSSPLKQREHPIRVPQPAPPDMPQPDSIIVEMDANQTIRPNQQPVSVDKLRATLFAISSRRANKEHAHSPRFRPSLRGCIRDLDRVRRSGAADIALLDKGERSGSPPKTEKGDQ